MKKLIFSTLLFSLSTSVSVQAAVSAVNCDAGELVSDALATAVPGDTIEISGNCNERLLIDKSDLTLLGIGTAVLDGSGQFFPPEVIRIDGAKNVSLESLSVQGGIFGLGLQNAATASLDSVNVQNNLVFGINIEDGSSASLQDVSITNNGVDGLDISNNSSVHISGSLISSNNTVFGINIVNNSSIRFSQAQVDVHGNALGMQIAVNSSGLIEDGATTLDTSNNIAIGLTVVATSSLFSFRGAIISNNNAANDGIAVFTNSSIDLDREATIEASNNGRDGVLLEGSQLNMVRMPGEAPSVVANGNARNGLSALSLSRADFVTETTLTATNNANNGVLIDDGSSARLVNASLNNNGAPDLMVKFGGRADLSTSNIGEAVCDKSALIRGQSIQCKKP